MASHSIIFFPAGGRLGFHTQGGNVASPRVEVLFCIRVRLYVKQNKEHKNSRLKIPHQMSIISSREKKN